ncbi:MAG: hypothetical protein JJ863_24605 [Deltaproteobacteria bacterium]|nr:hypothetical protein [Deltaproteobacteria bacterium]
MDFRWGSELVEFDSVRFRLVGIDIPAVALPEVLDLWLQRLRDTSNPCVFLPHSIDFECVPAFEARVDGSEVTLTAVELDGGWIQWDPDDFRLEMLSEPDSLVARRTQAFLSCPVAELEDAIASEKRRLSDALATVAAAQT